GGVGSITGSVVAAIAVTVLMEVLRFLDEPMNLIFVKTGGLPGLRMVVFSAMLMIVVIFRQRGLMGNREFSWTMVSGLRNAFVRKGPEGRGRGHDEHGGHDGQGDGKSAGGHRG
ncbi:MAG: hypothetical protein ABFC81_05320, partial [Rectinema sp.]